MTAILDGAGRQPDRLAPGQRVARSKQLTAQVRSRSSRRSITQVEAQLAPLEENLLDITLNQQVHPTPDSIRVRALDVQVLPAAKAQLDGNSLVNLQIGNVACAPVARVAVAAPAARSPRRSRCRPRSRPARVAPGRTRRAMTRHNGIVLAALAIMLGWWYGAGGRPLAPRLSGRTTGVS